MASPSREADFTPDSCRMRFRSTPSRHVVQMTRLQRIASFVHLGLGGALGFVGLGHALAGVVALLAVSLQHPRLSPAAASLAIVLVWALVAWFVALAIGLVGILDGACGLGLRRDEPEWRLLAAFLVVPNVLSVPPLGAFLLADGLVLVLYLS